MPGNVVVIIRSAYERTEALCVHLVEQQVPADQVVLIHERPFTAALRRSYEIGIEHGLDWTLCVDADVLIRKGAIRELLEAVQGLPSELLGGSGYIFDKLREGRHPGGLHLYRTSLLPAAFALISDPSVNLRPETYVKEALKKQGHDWALIDQTFGLHDFEQYYADIFRKTLVRVNKSSHQSQSMLKNALARSAVDTDFLVAAWGIRVGTHFSEPIDLNAEQWKNEANILLLANNMQEKESLDIEAGSQLVEKIYTELCLQQGPSPRQGGGTHRDQPAANRFYSGLWRFGWWVTQAGLRIQRAGKRRIADKP
jgi:hypothetical protein